MGFFNEIGRKVEKVKQSMDAAGDDGDARSGNDAESVCRECGARHATAYDFCPDCGSDAVEGAEQESDAVEGAEQESDADGSGPTESRNEE